MGNIGQNDSIDETIMHSAPPESGDDAYGEAKVDQADADVEPGVMTEINDIDKPDDEKNDKKKKYRGNAKSVVLRNLPPHLVMELDETLRSDSQHDTFQDDIETTKAKRNFNLLQNTCLKPSYSLRKQIMLSFGSAITVTILFVMLVSIIVTVTTTNAVKSDGRKAIKEVTEVISKSSPRYVSELLSLKVPLEPASMIAEAVMDRFAGYPYHEGYEDDSAVPFFDITAQRNKYPLNSTTLPLDWQINPNVNKDNYQEHVQNRWSWYGTEPQISTRSSFYFMQGTCDTTKNDSTCTEGNNNIETGGAVTPSPTNKQIARKAADLNFILKAIYEQYQDVMDIGVHFANAGAGSLMQFPHYQTNINETYTSIGCEWMSQPNPYDESRPIASDEEIGRCRPAGVEVSSREYNVLEQDWCRKMALHPNHTHVLGPKQSGWDDNRWYIPIGRAVYDRLTDEFIACILIHVSTESVDDIVNGVKILNNLEDGGTTVTLVKWDEEGTVVASPTLDRSSAKEPATIDSPDVEKGLTKENFEELKSLVNFEGDWKPEDVGKFEDKRYEKDGLLVSAFPLPPPPKQYMRDYFPQFMVILSLEKEDLQEPLNRMEGEANATEQRLIIIIVACSIAGLTLSFIFISLASDYITKPLKWINETTRQIVDQCGADYDKDIDFTSPVVFRFSPTTELSTLVKECQTMISRFSGRGSAKVEDNILVEVKNNFNLFADFNKLYSSRMEPGYKFNYNNQSSGLNNVTESNDTTRSSLTVPRRCYYGQNIVQSGDVKDNSTLPSKGGSVVQKRVYNSPLFWWIMGLILTPLLVTTITMSAIVAWKLLDDLPSLFPIVEDVLIDAEKDYVSSAVKLRAEYTELVTKRGLRELHIQHRVAGWLLFEGIERSSSFTEMTSAVDECKVYDKGTCPYLFDKISAPCDCEWNDKSVVSQTCYTYDDHSRYLQKQQYGVETKDTLPNGDRYSTSSPSSPSETEWLKNFSDAPGYEKGSSSEGYETTYDRLRVSSALSVIQMLLYNYNRDEHASLAFYFAFEADGMFLGYSGCNRAIDALAYWSSTEGNGAEIHRPELCPVGKYGYDPRCRGWYASGKSKQMNGTIDDSPLHVTDPYIFASSGVPGQSCTLPLVDPITNQYVGQSLVDFDPSLVFSALTESNTLLFNEGFSFIITAEGDTVTGPGFSFITDESKPAVEKLVLPYDEECESDCTNTDIFEAILDDMKMGNKGEANFLRTKEDSSTESVYIAYAPVSSTNVYPLNGSDFSHGVREYDSMIYSIALVLPESTRLDKSMDDLHRNVNIAIGVLCALIVIGATTITYILSRVTLSITTPILQFLDEIGKVNQQEVRDSSLHFTSNGGSKDMQNMLNTFEILFVVVHLANSAFFSGDLGFAYIVLVDALKAFKRLKNRKAMGVVNNNLRNIMRTMYRTMEATGDDMICCMTKKEVVSKGTEYFLRAIKLGEEAYDQFYEEEGWSKNCLVFMQHLSNRYFNRAIFLLMVREDHETPDLAKEMALRDLEISSDMDVEVADQCIDMGVVRSKKEHFELILGRVRGLLELLKMSYPDEWNLEEHLDSALKLLKSVIHIPSNDLFSTLGPAGRMQQLDCQLINYIKATSGNLADAARIAIRMLVEDEYILNDAYLVAIGTLIEYTGSESSDGWLEERGTVRRELMALRSVACVERSELVRRTSESLLTPDNIKSVVVGSSISVRTLAFSIVECNRGDVTMEIF